MNRTINLHDMMTDLVWSESCARIYSDIVKEYSWVIAVLYDGWNHRVITYINSPPFERYPYREDIYIAEQQALDKTKLAIIDFSVINVVECGYSSIDHHIGKYVISLYLGDK